MIEVLFDQYQRYKKTQEIINELRNKEEKFNILEVGANEHKNLEKFLPSDKITLEVIARIINVVIKVIATKDIPKLSEYITPLNVFL